MIHKGRIYLTWVIMNLIGFMLGSILGATNNGVVPIIIPGMLGILLGDLIFGATIGLAQWLALRHSSPLTMSAWWIVASSFGFMLGARSGALLTYRLVNEWLPPSVIFGVFMGGCISLATIWPLSQISAWPRSLGWIIISVPAWILGEGIAFAADFSQTTVPLVALTIGAITGLELLRLQSNTTVPLTIWLQEEKNLE